MGCGLGVGRRRHCSRLGFHLLLNCTSTIKNPLSIGGPKRGDGRVIDKEFMDGFSRTSILQLYACGKCGDCILACPVFEETQDERLAPAFRIRALKTLAKARYGIRALLFGRHRANPDEVQKFVSSVYQCTLCGRCMAVCPYQFNLIDLWEKARERAVESGFGLDTIEELINITIAEKNVLNRPHVRHKDWARGLIDVKEKAHTVYFVGCGTSYTPTLRPAARAVATLLNSAGEDWTILDDQWCCAIPQKFGGGTETLQDFAAHNVEAIESTGAEKVVFNCPGCYRMFKQEYPRILGRPLNFSPIHITELVYDYIKTGRISLKEKMNERITYHDPCELARLLGIIDQPRSVLEELSTSFLELPENKFNTRCCGSGGLYKAIDTKTSLEIAKRRINQAEMIGSSTIISACPACFTNLRQATRVMKSNIKVLDFADAVAQRIKDV
jgi:heterodisulfide reductase subunit D